jgi:RimJ/RimL family protein N-acetyltransferase
MGKIVDRALPISRDRERFGGLRVRHVRADEQALLRELRLASLASDPEAFGSTYACDSARAPAWWERWAAQSEEGTTQRTFVLVDTDDRGLGLALVRRDDERADTAVLNAMWVAPAARGSRAGAMLCDACAAWASARGLRELALTVVLGNDAALRAYEGAGFAVCGEATSSREGRTLSELVMSRAL